MRYGCTNCASTMLISRENKSSMTSIITLPNATLSISSKP